MVEVMRIVQAGKREIFSAAAVRWMAAFSG
jgi:hypothetical protein